MACGAVNQGLRQKRAGRCQAGPRLDRSGDFCDKPAPARHGAQVAQLVEHVTENHGVGGSIPPLGTIKIASFIFDLIWGR